MKRTFALSLLLSALAVAQGAVEWNSTTSGDQTVSGDVLVTGTANVGNITFTGDSTVSGSGTIGGSGAVSVNAGTVVFDGVSRKMGSGIIRVASGATLELRSSEQDKAGLVQDGWTNSASVELRGTLKVENLKYGQGQLGGMGSNSWLFTMYGGDTYDTSSRLEITKTGEATRGVKLQNTGFFTVAVAAGQTFSWINETGESTGIDTLDVSAASGSRLMLEAGDDATFILHKNIGAGVTLDKTGNGVLELNSTVNISGVERRLVVSAGTLRLGENANIQAVGYGFDVQEGAVLDMNGRGGNSGIAVSVNGRVVNAENNEMSITLGENGSFSIAADATSGYTGSLVLSEGATVDLGGFIFYNAIDVSAGGELLNAENHRGAIMLGVDEEGITYVDSAMLAEYGSSLASSGSVEVSLDANFTSDAPDYDLLRGRLYAEESLAITGTGVESVSLTGYRSEYGGLSAQNGDLSITEVLDVVLRANKATNERYEDYNRAGALSAAAALTIEAYGDIVVADNTASVNSDSAGAICASDDLSLSGASISITGNSVGCGDAENTDSYSGGALRSASGSIYLTATEGSVEISGNSADESGGALHASWGVKISAAEDISITGNKALTADGGAVYSDGDVILSPGEGAEVTISGNTAGGYGGAIYSYGTVYMQGGTYNVTGNTAGANGGAIYADHVEISADAGHITFSGNTHDGGVANDVELNGGTANLSASGGYTLEMQGGITGAADICVSTEDGSVVKLGGTSATEFLSVENGRLLGVTDAEGNMAVINVSTCVTLSDAVLLDILLVDEYSEAAWTSSATTYVYNDAVSEVFESLAEDAVNCTSSSTLLNGFASVGGDLSISLSQEFLSSALAAAEGATVNIALTLLEDTTAIDEDAGSFTLRLDDALAAWLETASAEEYGFYDAEGTLLGVTEVELTESGNVVFVVSGLSDVVPEPTSTALSLLALCGFCIRRRR